MDKAHHWLKGMRRPRCTIFWLYKPQIGSRVSNVRETAMLLLPTAKQNVVQNGFQVPFRTNLTGTSSVVVDCPDHFVESDLMSDEEDLSAQRTRMMEIWHEYSKTFNSFVTEEQLYPHRTYSCDGGDLHDGPHAVLTTQLWIPDNRCPAPLCSPTRTDPLV
jgi:hypothetical protein